MLSCQAGYGFVLCEAGAERHYTTVKKLVKAVRRNRGIVLYKNNIDWIVGWLYTSVRIKGVKHARILENR